MKHKNNQILVRLSMLKLIIPRFLLIEDHIRNISIGFTNCCQQSLFFFCFIVNIGPKIIILLILRKTSFIYLINLSFI